MLSFGRSYVGEIIESSGGSRHLSIILLKNFHLFKIAESVINFCLKKFLTNNFKQVEVFQWNGGPHHLSTMWIL